MKLRSVAVVGLALAGVLGAELNSRAEPDVQKDAEEARRSLRQHGYKTDLSDFDFSADPQTAARAAALTNFVYTRPIALLQPCGTECAIVAWKQARIEEQEEGYQNLPQVEQVLATNQATLDAACVAALAGPIRFPLTAKHGSSMLLLHLASLRNLSEALAARMILELRQERFGPAWTNLLALTRLATAWEPEPADTSHLVRYFLARTAWKAAWQALQARHWTEEQLIALQREWEAPDFFKGLPETEAFTRASMVDACIRERTNSASGVSLKDTLENAIRSPGTLPADLKYRMDRAQYRATGTYEDERDLLLFFRDRELELRQAITTSTWLEMSLLPAVTNTVSFRSKHNSTLKALLSMREMRLRVQPERGGIVARAAETEARRRLVIAAVALERYRVAHGSYPKDLQSLVPDVLRSVPGDFMDGKPLRYRLCEGGAFVLHSTGLDCSDDGGKLPIAKNAPRDYRQPDPWDSPDMLWPRAASDVDSQTLHLEQARAKQEQEIKQEREAEEREKAQEAQRQDTIAELADIYARGETRKIPDPKIEGRLLSEVLRNKAIADPALRIDQMLTLRQVATGEEPDIATFELPMSYDAVTNIGRLRLLRDADPSDDSSDGEAELEECARATNGNCRLVWNTTYDAPGKHFLQAELSIDNWRRNSRRRNRQAEEITLKGPLFAFVSTNVLQFFPPGNVYSDNGAFFRVKLAQPIGSYSLKLMAPTGEHIHTITGSTTNGIVEVHWDLIYAGGKRYTNDSFSSTWTVTFPDPPAPARTNTP